MTYYYNCRLVDGTGSAAIENAVLITEGTKIVYAGPAAGAPAAGEAKKLDMAGRTILPGIFNCHVHMALRFPFTPYCVDEYGTPGYRSMVMYRRAVEALYCGITTIRATGESDYSDTAVRDAINRGMFMGPRILTAGPCIIAHGGHGAGQWGSVECSGPYEFARETRNAICKGVDLIKICTTGGMVGEYEGAETVQMTEEVRRYARSVGKTNKDVTVIVAHMGGGSSVSLHRNGLVIDTNDALGGDGPISPERAGSVPGFPLVEMCFSGKYTKDEVKKKLVGKGGAVAYFGTNDIREIVARAQDGDAECDRFLKGFAVSVAKYIGSLATVVGGKVDAIILTGGIAHAKDIVKDITDRVGFIAPVEVYAGENELESLAENGYGILAGEFEIKEYNRERIIS